MDKHLPPSVPRKRRLNLPSRCTHGDGDRGNMGGSMQGNTCMTWIGRIKIQVHVHVHVDIKLKYRP